MSQINYDDVEVLISQQEIHDRFAKLGKEITEYYRQFEEPLVVVGLLKGSVFFMTELLFKLKLPIQIDFLTVSSYGDSQVSSRNVKILRDLDTDIQNKHVLIVEDIVDTGHTMVKVLEMLHARHPKSVKLFSAVSKPSRREVEVHIDWLGFEIPDLYVLGYGFDSAQYYRNLPFIGYIPSDKIN